MKIDNIDNNSLYKRDLTEPADQHYSWGYSTKKICFIASWIFASLSLALITAGAIVTATASLAVASPIFITSVVAALVFTCLQVAYSKVHSTEQHLQFFPNLIN